MKESLLFLVFLLGFHFITSHHHHIISGVAGHSFLAKVFSDSNLERGRGSSPGISSRGYNGHRHPVERETNKKDQQVARDSLE
jgi:hypothetical protein